MKKQSKKQPRIFGLNAKREYVRKALVKRWWQLETKRNELYRLVESTKIEHTYCVNKGTKKIIGRYLKELEREETRVVRLQTKYDLWASRLEYWTTLFDNAYYRLHPWYE